MTTTAHLFGVPGLDLESFLEQSEPVIGRRFTVRGEFGDEPREFVWYHWRGRGTWLSAPAETRVEALAQELAAAIGTAVHSRRAVYDRSSRSVQLSGEIIEADGRSNRVADRFIEFDHDQRIPPFPAQTALEGVVARGAPLTQLHQTVLFSAREGPIRSVHPSWELIALFDEGGRPLPVHVEVSGRDSVDRREVVRFAGVMRSGGWASAARISADRYQLRVLWHEATRTRTGTINVNAATMVELLAQRPKILRQRTLREAWWGSAGGPRRSPPRRASQSKLVELRALSGSTTLERMRRALHSVLGSRWPAIASKCNEHEYGPNAWLFADEESPPELTDLAIASEVVASLDTEVWVYLARFAGYELDELRIHQLRPGSDPERRDDRARDLEHDWRQTNPSGDQGEVVHALLARLIGRNPWSVTEPQKKFWGSIGRGERPAPPRETPASKPATKPRPSVIVRRRRPIEPPTPDDGD